MYDLISIGEILVDLTPAGTEPDGRVFYQANPGGAPANMACAAAKFGLKAAFIGAVGGDAFGRLCLASLKAAGVETAYLAVRPGQATTLAVVGLDETGDRSFAFYRKGTADLELSPQLLPAGLGRLTRALHFGSLSLSAEPARAATLAAANEVRTAGGLISFDPNYRDMVWPSLAEAQKHIKEAAPLAQVLKLSREDGQVLFGTGQPEEILRLAADKFSNPLVIVTLAEAGCLAAFGGRTLAAPAFKLPAVDTTGAGDAFMGGLLKSLLARDRLEDFEAAEIAAALAFANAAGSLTVTKKGGIPALPGLDEVKKLLRQ
ncbi:MAG: carbohydrate kinase [Candidatus Adiutrix sp.]|jgi:sugar/nucleoside kinase (ribokinase family)|nr:carbohydrate kinase [Candidatus Adiutrix sp.]